MLRGVGIARPEDEGERPARFLQIRKDNLRGRRSQIGLLRYVWDCGRRGLLRTGGSRDLLRQLSVECRAASRKTIRANLPVREIVDQDRTSVQRADILNRYRAKFANG